MRLHACFLAALMLIGAAPPDASADELRRVADRFDRAQIEQDRATLEAMTAPGLVFVDSDGVRRDRAQFIAGWLAPGLRFEPIEVTDRYIMPLGPDAGVVGGEVVLRGTSGSQPFASRIRFSDTFRRVDGRWQAVHIQATRVP